jgi:hypothetical protein
MGAIIALKYSSWGLQHCPAHQVLNSSRMVAGASKLEEGATMIRFQIMLSPDRNPDAHEILYPPPRRVWRLKAGLAALLMASAVIGVVLAALFLGSVIASLLVILVLIASVVAAIKAVVRHVARIRDRRRQYVAREC